MILIIDSDGLLEMHDCNAVILQFKVDMGQAELSLLKIRIVSQTFRYVLHSLLVFVHLNQTYS